MRCWVVFIFSEIGLQNLFQNQSRECHSSPGNQYSEKRLTPTKLKCIIHHIKAGKILLLIFQVLKISGIIKLVNIFSVRLQIFEYRKFSFLSIFLLLKTHIVFSTVKYIKNIILEVNNTNRVKGALLLPLVFRFLP